MQGLGFRVKGQAQVVLRECCQVAHLRGLTLGSYGRASLSSSCEWKV